MADNSKFMVGNEMRPFFTEVTKAFAEHSGANETIHAHPPATHGRESLHSQITLVNRSDGNACKIKFKE